jgi:hypothetical protein
MSEQYSTGHYSIARMHDAVDGLLSSSRFFPVRPCGLPWVVEWQRRALRSALTPFRARPPES